MNTFSLPNFVHFGTPKSGSATISHFLASHPQVYTPRPKELNFFNRVGDYEKGPDWFASTYFSGHSREPIICDKSIGYSVGDPEGVLERIVKTLGRDIRILLTVRHPAERAFSHYCMARFKGQIEDLSFTEAIRTAIDVEDVCNKRKSAVIEDQSFYGDSRNMALYRNATYLMPGRYAWLLKMCQDAFGTANVLVLFTEDMQGCLPGVISNLTEFLEIDTVQVDPDLRLNSATSLRLPWVRRMYNKAYAFGFVRNAIRELSPGVRRFLRKRFLSWNYKKNESVPQADPNGISLLQDYYSKDILNLEELTGRDLSNWKARFSVLLGAQ